MASKTFSALLGSGNFAKLEAECTSVTNEAGNYSTVTIKLYGVTLFSGSMAVDPRPGTRSTINGADAKTVTANAFNRSSAGRTLLATFTHTVPHDDDGSKTVSVNVAYPIQATVQGVSHGTVNVGGTLILDKIPRGMVNVGTSTGIKKGQVWVGDGNGVPRKAKAVYVGDAGGVPRKAK